MGNDYRIGNPEIGQPALGVVENPQKPLPPAEKDREQAKEDKKENPPQETNPKR
jgi:hypothetical protein